MLFGKKIFQNKAQNKEAHFRRQNNLISHILLVWFPSMSLSLEVDSLIDLANKQIELWNLSIQAAQATTLKLHVLKSSDFSQIRKNFNPASLNLIQNAILVRFHAILHEMQNDQQKFLAFFIPRLRKITEKMDRKLNHPQDDAEFTVENSHLIESLIKFSIQLEGLDDLTWNFTEILNSNPQETEIYKFYVNLSLVKF
jgi:hypothetical protein